MTAKMAASMGRPSVRVVWRAELPCAKSTRSPWPAPMVSAATTYLLRALPNSSSSCTTWNLSAATLGSLTEETTVPTTLPMNIVMAPPRASVAAHDVAVGEERLVDDLADVLPDGEAHVLPVAVLAVVL